MIRGSLLVRAPIASRAASLPAVPVSWRLVGNPRSPVPFIRKRPGTPHRLAAPLMSVPPGKSG